MNAKKAQITPLHTNKKALFDYEVISSYEAAIKLTGSEVKSMRGKHCNLKGAYVSLASGRPMIKGLHISPYAHLGNKGLSDPIRERELFLKKKDIDHLAGRLKEKGLSLIPLEVYSKGNLIKIQVALAHGRKVFEKKQVLKERDINRDAQREIGRF